MTPEERKQAPIDEAHRLRQLADIKSQLADKTEELATISACLDKEFGPTDIRSGDLLDDMGCFIDHHKKKEAELAALKSANEKLVELLKRTKNSGLVYCECSDCKELRGEIEG